MEKIIILIGQKDDIEQAIAELKSNIQYDNLEVIIKEKQNGKTNNKQTSV